MTSIIEDDKKFSKNISFTIMKENKLEKPLIPELSYYKQGSVIGRCSFASGTVYAGQFISTNQLIAVKRYNAECLSISEIKLIQHEVNLMKQIRSPYVLTCLVSFVVGCDVICILPLLEYGSCADLITKYFNSGLPEVIINLVLKDIVKALQFIHSKGIIHRSIRASHILVGSDGHAKLTGFRYAFKKENDNTFMSRLTKVFEFPPCRTSDQKWLSPDILQQNLCGYNEKSDIYSLGLTVCELANGIEPFRNTRSTIILLEKINGAIPLIYDKSTFDMVIDDFDEELVNTLKKYYLTRQFSKYLHSFKNLCCILKPEERPDTKELLIHSLFKRIGERQRLFSDHIFPAVPITDNNFLTFNSDISLSMVEDLGENNEYLFDWEL